MSPPREFQPSSVRQHDRLLPLLLAAWGALAILPGPASAAQREVVRQYLTTVSDENPEARGLRHGVVAARRAGPIVMVHRGASAFAPENSLEAYAAAMDYGGDGCEVDLRRTRDGVLVLFHDDTLDRLTQGFGRVDQITFRELEGLRSETAFGRTLFSPPPTFAAVLDLARERGMLLHLDLKQPGLEAEVIQLLDQADAWDHVVYVNETNARSLVRDPRLRLLQYKVPGLYQDRLDVDPGAVESGLAQPGQMILVDDPRVAAMVLKRLPYHPLPYTKKLRLIAAAPLARDLASAGEFCPLAFVRALANRPEAASLEGLLGFLQNDESTRPTEQRVLERAWAAQQLGQRGNASRRVIAALERQARHATPHPDWAYHGLDAAMAIRALGRLQARRAAGTLVSILAEGVVADAPGTDLALRDFHVTMQVFPALGEMKCGAARRFLRRYVRMTVEEARRYGPPQFEEATRALLRQRLTWDQIAELLRSPNRAVRGTAIIECLDHWTEERGLALRQATPWAVRLPRAGR